MALAEDAVSKNPRGLSFPLLIVWSALLISVLQGIYFAVRRPATAYSIAAIVLAALAVWVGLRSLKRNQTRLFGGVAALLVVQLGAFAAELAGSGQEVPLRILQVAICAAYLVPVLAALLAATRVVSPIQAAMLSSLLAAALFVSETVLASAYSGNAVRHTTAESSRLIGAMKRDPLIGAVNVPNSILTAYYEGDPQGIFREADPRARLWTFWTSEGNTARAIFPSTDPEAVRVEITRTSTGRNSYIQLYQANLHVKAKTEYVLNLRARSDRPREAVVGLAQGHAPYKGLGLYATMALTPQWRSFAFKFTTPPDADDDNAEVHFNLQGHDASVEVSAVHLRSLADNLQVDPTLALGRGNYALTYKFNSAGCRAAEYPVPKPNGTTRLLLLGNSYTLGAGVPAEAVVSSQLDRLLNVSSGTAVSALYEVINCATSGYGTREERLFYERAGARYQPDVVLVGVTWRDDMSFWEEAEKAAHPARQISLFYTWKVVEDRLHPPAHTDFSRCVEELRQLNREVQSRKARLVAFIFRNNADYSGSTETGRIWNKLTRTMEEGLQGSDILVMDAGRPLLEGNSGDDLKAHAALGFEPNAVAHKIAAREVAAFLQREKLARP